MFYDTVISVRDIIGVVYWLVLDSKDIFYFIQCKNKLNDFPFLPNEVVASFKKSE